MPCADAQSVWSRREFQISFEYSMYASRSGSRLSRTMSAKFSMYWSSARCGMLNQGLAPVRLQSSIR